MSCWDEWLSDRMLIACNVHSDCTSGSPRQEFLVPLFSRDVCPCHTVSVLSYERLTTEGKLLVSKCTGVTA